MMANKLGFDDFILTVDSGSEGCVRALHEWMAARGCAVEVKEAKSGFVVTYTLNKKAVFNYVFRKKGLIIRIYANHISDYMEFLDTLPKGMEKAVAGAPVCKRLINPEACNAKCPMGYDFIMNGERYQKCRYNAFMFPVCEENFPFIKELLEKELDACAV